MWQMSDIEVIVVSVTFPVFQNILNSKIILFFSITMNVHTELKPDELVFLILMLNTQERACYLYLPFALFTTISFCKLL